MRKPIRPFNVTRLRLTLSILAIKTANILTKKQTVGL